MYVVVRRREKEVHISTYQIQFSTQRRRRREHDQLDDAKLNSLNFIFTTGKIISLDLVEMNETNVMLY